MASRSSSTSEGEVADTQHKANTISQRGETAINGSSRVSGLDGASDRNGRICPLAHSRHRLIHAGYKYRALSRSPSPYRRKRTQSPSPYRNNRAVDRSPSPFRHGRNDRGHDGNDPRSQHKRKASPPRGSRPEKRHNTDRSRHGDRLRKPYADDSRNGQSRPSFVKATQGSTERPHAKPVSYAEIDNQTPAVPGFSDSLIAGDKNARQNNYPRTYEKSSQQVTRDTQKLSIGQDTRKLASNEKDVQMCVKSLLRNSRIWLTTIRSNSQDEPDVTLAPVEDKGPTQETREEKRRRWAAIRAAAEHKPKENLLQQAVLTNASESTTPNVASPAPYLDTSMSPFPSPRAGDLDSVPASPDVMIIDKQAQDSRGNSPAVASPSAADYDPTQDMLDDRNRALKKGANADLPSDAYSETDPKVLSTLPGEKVASVKKQRKDFDMFDFSDDEDEGGDVEPEPEGPAKGTVLDEKLLENWDDPEGYYKIINNELVNGGRYRMIKTLGRGVFANVAQAEEIKADSNDQHGRLVAIKMIRRNELMRKASQKEVDFLQKVNEADPQDKRHIIRLLGSFDHKGHLCIIFEHMSKNLRDLLKEETNGHGLALPAVRTYARQMFLGLQHLQNCQVIHLDLKPDNVLVSADKKTVKLADFGTAVDKRDNIERTEYLVSRFYRAPEIILGMDIGHPVDMWAVGCTAYELWTGKILFTGRSNNQMIKAFMDCLGWPSEKLLKKGLLNNVLEHFEAGPPLKFISREVDQYNQVMLRTTIFTQAFANALSFLSARSNNRRKSTAI